MIKKLYIAECAARSCSSGTSSVGNAPYLQSTKNVLALLLLNLARLGQVSQCLHDHLGNWEWRLPQTELDDVPSVRPEFIGSLVDGNSCARLHAANVQIQVLVGPRHSEFS